VFVSTQSVLSSLATRQPVGARAGQRPVVSIFLGPKQVALHMRSWLIGEDVEDRSHRRTIEEYKSRARAGQAAKEKLTPLEVAHIWRTKRRRAASVPPSRGASRTPVFPRSTPSTPSSSTSLRVARTWSRHLALHDLTFLDRGQKPLFIGVPGGGKTFLAKLAFQVISERYDYRRSTAVTTNRLFKDWTQVFPDPLNAQVIAERLTERSEHFILERGYRTQR